MSAALMRGAVIGVVGAGAMGSGIAQVAARAGHPVVLVDANPSAAASARERIAADLDRLAARGKLSVADRDLSVARVMPAASVAELSGASLVIEAIVERLDAKIALLREVEAAVAADAILATNTSSLSVTAIAAGLSRPERCAGFHFFNPAPVMRLVEVVRGAQTARPVVETLLATASAWGKRAVETRSTPGFIVNRVARPFYGEALRLLEEEAVDPATLDALMVEGGGFRMGPCALMDLIGHDVNYAVTCSMFDAFHQDPRYRPSLLQKELVEAGWLGRKTGRGFHRHDGTGSDLRPREVPAAGEARPPTDAGPLTPDGSSFAVGSSLLARTDGRTAAARALAEGRPAMLYDLLGEGGRRVALAASPDVPAPDLDAAVAGLATAGVAAERIADRPGLAVMRTVAMIANEAFEARLQGVASEADIDAAMLDGVNYPKGPFAWAAEIGRRDVLAVLDHLRDATRDPRYRASLGLRLAADADALAARREKRA